MTARRLALAVLSAGQPMGQQVYEGELIRRAPDELGPGWRVDPIEVRTLRSSRAGTVRIPSWSAGRCASHASPSCRSVHLPRIRCRPSSRPPPASGTPSGGADHSRHCTLAVLRRGFGPRRAAATARNAAAVVCPSQFAADEISRQFDVADPVAIHNGVDPRFFDATPLPERQLEDLGVRFPFIVHAGGCTAAEEPRRPGGGVAAGPLGTPRDHVGTDGAPDPRRDRLFAALPGAIRLGRVDDEIMPAIMAAASVVVVPSVYEGFGLPALEGMAVGTPVVAVDRSSLPEVCGDGAYLVEPDGAVDSRGYGRRPRGGGRDRCHGGQGRERATGFTWEASLAAHAGIWRSCVD